MSCQIGRLQALYRDVGVNLRGGKTGMPKQRLHASQARSVVQEMRCKTVTQFVWREIRGQPGLKESQFQQGIDGARRNPATRFVKKERSTMNARGLAIF